MRKILEDFYYGNLTPGDREMAPDSELRQAVGKAADCEEQLTVAALEVSQGVYISGSGLLTGQLCLAGCRL